MKHNIFFIFLLLINIINLSAQERITNLSFLNALKANYPQLLSNDMLILTEAAKVKHIYLPYNQYESKYLIEGEIDLKAFVNLEILNVAGNKITHIKNLSGRLEQLNCSYNQITSLDVSNYEYLRELHCSHNLITDLKVRSAEFFNMTIGTMMDEDKLYFVDCAYNPIKRIKGLNSCGVFICDGVNINNIANFWDSLPCNLENFSCNYTQIDTMPELYLPLLEVLECKGNKLKRLPKNLQDGLSILDCSYNELVELPRFLPLRMKKLDCSHNLLQYLPEYLPQRLKELKCNHNQLIELPELLPFELETIHCEHNQLKEILYLPCLLKEIYADSNLIHTVGNIPPSVEKMQLQANPILDSNLLVQKGWFKNQNNQWDKPRTAYQCGLNYAIKMHCDSCVKGYELTDKAKELTLLDLNEYFMEISLYNNRFQYENQDRQNDTIDLSALLGLKVFSANDNRNINLIIFPPSIQAIQMQDSKVDKVLGLGNNLRYLEVGSIKPFMPLSDSLRWLKRGYDYFGNDTLTSLPKLLKVLDIDNGQVLLDKNIEWPKSLEYIHFKGYMPKGVFPNLRYLNIEANGSINKQDLMAHENLNFFSCKCSDINNLDSLPPNLDTLILENAYLSKLKQLTLSDNIRYLQLKKSRLYQLESITAQNLIIADLSENGITKLQFLDAPKLEELNLRDNKLTNPIAQLPKMLTRIDYIDNPITEQTWLNMSCEWWKQINSEALLISAESIKAAGKLYKKMNNKSCFKGKFDIYYYQERGKGMGWNVYFP